MSEPRSDINQLLMQVKYWRRTHTTPTWQLEEAHSAQTAAGPGRSGTHWTDITCTAIRSSESDLAPWSNNSRRGT